MFIVLFRICHACIGFEGLQSGKHSKDRNATYWQLIEIFILSDDTTSYHFLYFRPTTNAIMALTVANYLVQPFFGDCLPDTAIRLLAAVFICGLTWLNTYSMKITTKLQNIFMVTKVSALALVIMVGVYALSQGKSRMKITLSQCGRQGSLNTKRFP